MNRYRRNAVATGILLVVATVGAIAGTALYKPFLGDPLDATTVVANATRIYAGAALQLLAYASCPAIAIALYPVLRGYSEALSLGSVAFRTMEAIFYSIGVVGVVLLVTMSETAVRSGIANSPSFQQPAATLIAARDLVGSVGGVAFFATGGFLYYWVLFRSSLVPRWLSGWGLIAAAMSLGAAALVLFEVVVPLSTTHIVLNLPIFVQEMVLAVWLIAKGFDQRVADRGPVAASSLAGAHSA
jgi:hypothetical protein